MGVAIDYQKIMIEIVYVNLPGPAEPQPGMSGGELLHGFLAELHESPDPATRQYVEKLCARWSIHYRYEK
jgi:hypothetical protein